MDMFSALIGPLLFACLGGAWAYFFRPERRHGLIGTLIGFQLLGAWGVHQQPTPELMMVVGLLGVIVLAMLIHILVHSPHPQRR